MVHGFRGGISMNFNVLNILLYLAIILLATKIAGLVTRKLGLPQVVGMVIAGLLIGPAIFSQITFLPFDGLIVPNAVETDVLKTFSQVGVVLILFSSGLETDTKELGKSGFAATMVALLGVIVPLALGTGVAALFMGGLGALKDHDTLMNALFVGCILAATSVGITVETLRELGKLKTKVGTTILSAAIIDDVIGIIALSVITSLNGDGSVGMTLLKSALFFAAAIGLGFPIKYAFVWICKRYPHSRRLGIFALAVCFLYSYIAEEFFGIAAITGAFLAGIMFSGLRETEFVDKNPYKRIHDFFTHLFCFYRHQRRFQRLQAERPYFRSCFCRRRNTRQNYRLRRCFKALRLQPQGLRNNRLRNDCEGRGCACGLYYGTRAY